MSGIGFVLHTARFGDVLHGEEVILYHPGDPGYIEIRSQHLKTANVLGKCWDNRPPSHSKASLVLRRVFMYGCLSM
eukprot:4232181-Amphidinium_carterae.1